MTTPDDLAAIARRTLAHYDDNATSFEAGTRDHDVRRNIATLLRHVEAPAPATILDFGCGPGRDLRTFAALGHRPIGLDGSAAFVRMARDAVAGVDGADVWRQDFFALDLPPARFDGVFANATLQHVPTALLPRVLAQLNATLKPRGVLFASIPRGDNEEGWSGARYSAFHDLDAWRRHVVAAGFVELEHYYRPEGLPRDQQRWLASAWRSVEAQPAG